jgi:hypothetical protein
MTDLKSGDRAAPLARATVIFGGFAAASRLPCNIRGNISTFGNLCASISSELPGAQEQEDMTNC